MAKIKQISFVLNETDNIVVNVKQIAEEYQIPLNSALKVYFLNLIKENNFLKQEKTDFMKNNFNQVNISPKTPNSPPSTSIPTEYKKELTEEKMEILTPKIEVEKTKVIDTVKKDNNEEKKATSGDGKAGKAKDFAAMMGFGT